METIILIIHSILIIAIIFEVFKVKSKKEIQIIKPTYNGAYFDRNEFENEKVDKKIIKD